MAELLQNFSLFPLVLTIGSYQIGLWCQKKTKSPICNPLLKYVDPETNDNGRQGGSFQLMKSYSFGINLNF